MAEQAFDDETLVQLAESAQREDSRVDFKSRFEPFKKAAFWVEIVKDIIAMANSDGGVLIFGLNDDATPSSEDVSSLLTFDPADLTNQLAKYTGLQFSDFFISAAVRASGTFPFIGVRPTRLPIAFTKPGTYAVEDAKTQQKTAFSLGTLYFRHGAKSEPATQHDIRDSFYRELRRSQAELFENIGKMIAAGPGARIVVSETPPDVSGVRLSADPSAPIVRVADLSETHPYRQGELIKQVKSRVNKKFTLNSHDIKCIKAAEEVDPETRPDLVHKPHAKASPQYSEGFVDFVADKIAANENYLLSCRAKHKANQK